MAAGLTRAYSSCQKCFLRFCCCCGRDASAADGYPLYAVPEIETEGPVTSDLVVVHQILEGIKVAAWGSSNDPSKPPLPTPPGTNGKHLYNMSSPSSTKGGTVVMKEYFPSVFRAIRKQENIRTREFVEAWTFAKGTVPAPEKGAGRSGSLFMVSANERYIFKIIPRHEAQTLKAILRPYQEHIAKNGDSRLMRFLSLLRFQVRSSFFYLVVSNNVFYSPKGLKINQKFDLKGRTPKASTLQSREKIEFAAKGNIWKDNQIKRSFAPDEAATLVSTLRRDAEFLRDQNCIDYSLLVGVHDVEPKIHKTNVSQSSTFESSPRKKRQYSFSVVCPAAGVGIPSHHNAKQPEIYFFGIIDFLSRYYIKKKSAHFLKSFRWTDATLSTVPPGYYCDRWAAYLPTVIKTVDSQGQLVTPEAKPRTNSPADASLNTEQPALSRAESNSSLARQSSNDDGHRSTILPSDAPSSLDVLDLRGSTDAAASHSALEETKALKRVAKTGRREGDTQRD